MGSQLQTRLHVVEALDTLMQCDPIKRVKVARVCKLVGISRTTFYEYFDDIYSVVTWYWDYIMRDALYAVGISCDHYTGHVRSFEMLLANRTFFYEAFKCKEYNGPLEYGARNVKRIMVETAERRLGRSFTEREVLMLEFRNYGASNMTRQWIDRGMKETPEEIASVIEACTPDFFVEALRV
ncbi:MAG: TetR/AcrR family transcriptional regulator C-terminal domain-containing protein [Coriobacteriales bacterium]|nr:TetR/AcrR family transcriptional regulator C-terminal domain-containing protein [Coriobacteriales bacterium]